MFASRLFWKLFITYTALILLTTAGFVVVVSQRQQTLLEEQHQRRLQAVAVVLRDSLSEKFPKKTSASLQRRLEKLAADTRARITLIRRDGIVVGDSDFDPMQMENHADRPEILQAETGEIGQSRRKSPTLEIPMMYVAVPISVGGQIVGFARVAADMATIHAQSAALKTGIFIAAALVS